MIHPAAGGIGEWTGLDQSAACFGVSLFRHEIVGYKEPRPREEKSFTSSIMNHNAGSGLVTM